MVGAGRYLATILRAVPCQVGISMSLRSIFSMLPALSLAVLTVSVATATHAQPDPDQPLYIHALDADIDEGAGVITYRGEVRLEQAGLSLSATELTARYAGQTLTQVLARGNPVEYLESGAQGKTLRAVGNQFEYSAEQHQIVVSGRAEIEQDGNRLQGEKIVYNLTEQKARLVGPQKGRVRTTINPDSGVFPHSDTSDNTSP